MPKDLYWNCTSIDLTHVIDTSLAYIPGHGTPTVVILGRHRMPVSYTVRAVRGIKREDSQPIDPSKGLVWNAMLEQIDYPGSEGSFVSVSDIPREVFAKHPWSLGGGGAAELKQELDERCNAVLGDVAQTAIGLVMLEDEAFTARTSDWLRRGVRRTEIVSFVEGEKIRDWHINETAAALFPYARPTLKPNASDAAKSALWYFRSGLRQRLWFRKTQEERGLAWFEYGLVSEMVMRISLSIPFSFVGTHNHFVFDRGNKVFKQSAPVIKLSADSGDQDHLQLVGLLNSSTGAFWMRQVFHDKGGGGIGGGIAAETWERFFEYDATKIKSFPLPNERPETLPKWLDSVVERHVKSLPLTLLSNATLDVSRQILHEKWLHARSLRSLMISLQEELDWQCYRLYKLIDEDLTYGKEPPPIQLGQRAFEIVMARQMAAGELETAWFDRHGSTPLTEIPAQWSEEYRTLVERRIELIETDRNIGLIEQPEYKRRWNTESWESQLERVLCNWLLDRLENYFDFDGRMNDECKPTEKTDIMLTSTARLADIARQDAEFIQVGELYRNDPAFDAHRLVAELVEAESVPLLPILRYKDSGLRKRREWEQTWDLQRQEDAIDACTKLSRDNPQYLTELQARDLKRRQVGDIPVPSKYTSSDFASSTSWRLRGKLDVPRERWVSFPHCEGPDGTLMIAWAGYNHLQLARAVSAYYVDIQERLGGRDDPRLVPLLACLIELLPWLKQWYNDVDPEFGMHIGDYFEGFIQEEARQMGKTLDQIKTWEPPKKTRRRSKGMT
jgi:hypothetical protein